MLILLSPTKNMNLNHIKEEKLEIPVFIEEAKKLASQLRCYSAEELQALMKINEKLAKCNEERWETFGSDEKGSAAILTYDGIQYRNIKAEEFTVGQKEYAQQSVRILSGLYGCLAPYSSIYPYRLEMLTKLSVENHKNLYAFWGDKIYTELRKQDSIMLNLASKEYSKVVEPYVTEETKFVTCTFYVSKKGALKNESTAAKIARGMMCRYLVQQQSSSLEEVKEFCEGGFVYSSELSNEQEYVFIKSVE